MAATKLGTRAPMINPEQQTGKFAASATLSTAGFTIPANTGEVWCYPSAACHYNPTGAATASFMHAAAAEELFLIKASEVSTCQIIGDAGAMTLTAIYMRGSGRADGGGSPSKPL